MTLPDCMIWPSEPCDAYAAAQARILELEAELAQARAERGALRADAERFRWIVDGGPYDGPSGRFNKAWREWDGSDNFRAAIDAARAEKISNLRHVCGERGYNIMIDPACPACEQSRHNAARKETSHD